MADPFDSHRFVCRGCHVRYAHLGQCEICGSEIVIEAEWPRDDSGAMQAPEPEPHAVAAIVAVLAAAAASVLAWGEVTLWGVLPCAAVTVVLVFVPVTRHRRRDVNEELEGYSRSVAFDAHPLAEGTAREMAAVTSSQRPIGCIGLFVGVVLPLVVIRPEHPDTIAAGLLAAAGFVVAWVRRVRRESEASAGRGVPL